jgi:hypothetical protein
MGDIDTKSISEEELDRLLVEMLLKMSPEQLEKAADMILYEKELCRKEENDNKAS